MAEPIVAIVEQIRDRIAEIDRELQDAQSLQTERERLSRALAELGQQESTRRQPIRPAGERHRRRTRAAQGSNPERILTALAESPDVTAIEIGRAAQIDRKTLYSTLARMVRAGRVLRQESEQGPIYSLGAAREPSA